MATHEVSETEPVQVRKSLDIGYGIGVSTRWAYKDEVTLQSGFPTLHWTPGELCPAGNPEDNVPTRTSRFEATLTIRMVFHLPLRQTEGFLHSLTHMLEIVASDLTQLATVFGRPCRRGGPLDTQWQTPLEEITQVHAQSRRRRRRGGETYVRNTVT